MTAQSSLRPCPQPLKHGHQHYRKWLPPQPFPEPQITTNPQPSTYDWSTKLEHPHTKWNAMGWPAGGGEATKAAAGKNTRGAALHTHMVGGLGHFFFQVSLSFPIKKWNGRSRLSGANGMMWWWAFSKVAGDPWNVGWAISQGDHLGANPTKSK